MSKSSVAIPGIVLAAVIAAAVYGWAVVALTPAYPGVIGINLNALGTDYMPFYGGVQWLFDGRLAELYSGEQFTAFLNTFFKSWLTQPLAYRPWVYPPTYLFPMLPFGLLPFAASYAAFQAVSASLLAAALWFGVSRPNSAVLVVAAALLAPAAAITVGLGQNSFLAAALLVGGFSLLRKRPVLGGIVLGLLSLKPQDCLLIPIALLAARQWKALAAAGLTAATLAVASVAAFGIAPWQRWLELATLGFEQAKVGAAWDDSIEACLLAAGASPVVARGLQFGGIIVAAYLVYATFRVRALPADNRLAVLLALTVLAAPHSSLSDSLLLAAAAGLWAADAVRQQSPLAAWTLPLALWLAPLFNPPLVSAAGRLTPLLILGFALMTIAPAWRMRPLAHSPSLETGLAEE